MSAPLDLIDPKICLIQKPYSDFATELETLSSRNDIRGMVRLYDTLITAGDAAFAILTELRATSDVAPSFLEDISFRILDDTLAHAYAVADALKHLPPENDEDRQSVAKTLFDCALRMEVGLDGAIAIVNFVNEGSR